MDEILKEVLMVLRQIQMAHKGSIGTIDNVYLPQLDRKKIDALVTRVACIQDDIGRQKHETKR